MHPERNLPTIIAHPSDYPFNLPENNAILHLTNTILLSNAACTQMQIHNYGFR